MNWPRYTPEKREYMVLNGREQKFMEGLRARKCGFWNDLIPQLTSMRKNKRIKHYLQTLKTLCLRYQAVSNATYYFFLAKTTPIPLQNCDGCNHICDDNENKGKSLPTDPNIMEKIKKWWTSGKIFFE